MAQWEQNRLYPKHRLDCSYLIDQYSFEQNKKGMSKNDELKKLKERIEALEFIKELQQDIIVDFEKTTGEELSKKYLPEVIANDIARKKKKLTK